MYDEMYALYNTIIQLKQRPEILYVEGMERNLSVEDCSSGRQKKREIGSPKLLWTVDMDYETKTPRKDCRFL